MNPSWAIRLLEFAAVNGGTVDIFREGYGHIVRAVPWVYPRPISGNANDCAILHGHLSFKAPPYGVQTIVYNLVD